MKNPQTLFNDILAKKISQNPLILSGSGIQNKTLCFVVDGNLGGQWQVAFDSTGSVSLQPVQNSTGDCIVQMNEETFMGLISGTVNVAMAFMFRKIKISGDKNIAIKVGQTLQIVLK